MIVQLVSTAVCLSHVFKIIVTNTSLSSLPTALNKDQLIKSGSAKILVFFYWPRVLGKRQSGKQAFFINMWQTDPMTLDASPLKTASPCPACLVLAVVLEHVIPHTKATLLWCSPHRNHSSYLPVSASLAKAIFLIFVLSSMWLWGYQETCGCLCLGTLPLASTLHEQSVHGLLADFTDLHLLDWLCACSQASQAVSLGHRFQQGCTWMDSMHSIAICPIFFF